MSYQTIIGLEIHVQLKTKSKMFCSCKNEFDIESPNKNICEVCMGHPGTLPVANRQAIEWTILAGLALNCTIPKVAKFDRKSYFYPDLPKGYQISQYDQPFAVDGFLTMEVNGRKKRIRIKRVHLEEDTGKLLHPQGANHSLVDFNRAGTPLMEIVSEPDITSPLQAKLFLQEIQKIMRYLEISDANMEKGHMRCDANISVQKTGDKEAAKVEIKNMNSFRAVERALTYEEERLKDLWEEESPLLQQETRGWVDAKGITVVQRVKEEAQDYRYFPEPDLPPIQIEEKLLQKIKDALPELPKQKRARLQREYGLPDKDIQVLVDNRRLAQYFEEVATELQSWIKDKREIPDSEFPKLVKLAANYIITEFVKLLREKGKSIEESKVTEENFAELTTLIYEEKINSSQAQAVLREMMIAGKDPSMVILERGWTQLSDEGELTRIAMAVIKKNPKAVASYKKGKANALQFLVGQVMKETKGKANPKIVQNILKEELK